MKSLFLKISSCLILITFFTCGCFAGMSSEVTVEGYVIGVNGDQVTLLVGSKKMEVSKKDIPTYYNLNSGRKVVAIFQRKIDKKKN